MKRLASKVEVFRRPFYCVKSPLYCVKRDRNTADHREFGTSAVQQFDNTVGVLFELVCGQIIFFSKREESTLRP